MINSNNKLQLYRSKGIYSDKKAAEAALSGFTETDEVVDGRPFVFRYRDGNNKVKNLIGIGYESETETGTPYIAQIAEGVNSSAVKDIVQKVLSEDKYFNANNFKIATNSPITLSTQEEETGTTVTVGLSVSSGLTVADSTLSVNTDEKTIITENGKLSVNIDNDTIYFDEDSKKLKAAAAQIKDVSVEGEDETKYRLALGDALIADSATIVVPKQKDIAIVINNETGTTFTINGTTLLVETGKAKTITEKLQDLENLINSKYVAGSGLTTTTTDTQTQFNVQFDEEMSKTMQATEQGIGWADNATIDAGVYTEEETQP